MSAPRHVYCCDGLGSCAFPAMFTIANDHGQVTWALCAKHAVSATRAQLEADEYDDLQHQLEAWATTPDGALDATARNFRNLNGSSPHWPWLLSVWEARNAVQQRIAAADDPQQLELPIDEPGPPVFTSVGVERNPHDPGHLDEFTVRTFTHAHGEMRMTA